MKLRHKLFLPPLVLLLVGVLLHLWWLPNYRSQIESSIVFNQKAILQTLSTAVLPHLLKGDFGELYALLDEQRAQHPEWQQLKLHKPDGDLFYPLKKNDDLISHMHLLQQDVSFQERVLGTLEVVIDTDALVEQETKAVAIFTNILPGLIFLLALIAVWWQEYLLRRPLTQLADAASSIAAGNFSTPLPVAGNDEIGRLVGAFSTMRDRISHTQWELKSEANREAGRVQAIMDNVIVAIITIDSVGIIGSFNPAAERIFGYPRDEIIGKNISLLIPGLGIDGESGDTSINPQEHEMLALRQGGAMFPAEVAINRVVINGETVSTAIVRDISHRKQVAFELEVQRRQIEIISSAQSLFIGGRDPVEIFEGILPEILKLTQSEIGLVGEAMSSPDGVPYLKIYALSNISWDKATSDMYQEGGSQGLEFHNLDNLFGQVILSGGNVISNDPANDPHSSGLPAGHPAMNSFLGVPVYLWGKLLGMIGLANRPGGYDETVVSRLQPILSTCAQIFDAVGKDRERKRTALDLKRSNSFMAALVENLQAGLLVEDEAGKIYAVNQIYCDMFGKDEMPLMIEGGECADEFESNQALFTSPGALLQWRKECLGGLKVITGREFELLDGRVFEQDYVPIILEDEQGLIHRSHLWSYRDISEHKHIQEKLEQTAEVAEAATRAKSQFLATMSHEIRTPMNGVLGMLHLLGKTTLDARQQRFVDTAAGSGEMLLKVINDILDFSKLEAEKLELESIPFDLVELLEQSVALLATQAHEKGVELLCTVAADVPQRVLGDPVRLRQVLSNLINNAIKFTEHGEIVLYATMSESDRIHFGVRDSGIGMNGAQQQLLFRAFSQVDSSHTRKYGGTGLGLAISQKLIAAMGGEIVVSSAPGTGSDFSFDLLLQVAVDKKPRKRFSEALSGKRFLVVDDNPYMREMLQYILGSWQATDVDMALGGNDALTQMRGAAAVGRPYDIVMLDKRMPDIDGVALARVIRADSTLSGVILIMLSALEQDQAVPELDAWLAKPLRQSDLYNTLLTLLGETEANPATTAATEDGQELWFGKRRLLLVEDNSVNQEVAQEILGAAGFVIDISQNGAEAVQAVQQHSYDAVLMDIQMPVMDGLEAACAIRALGGHFTTLPIIAMTAHALSGDAEKSLAAGMNGHVTKPINPDAVFRELARWVEPGEKPVIATEQISAVVVERLPELPGIDVADGLQRLRGNWAVYRRILQGFCDKQADAAETIAAYIEQGAWDEASRLAHTLKGSGGNIGAIKLHQLAAELEQHCRRGDEAAARALLEPLRITLAEIVAGVMLFDKVGTVTADRDSNEECLDLSAWHELLDRVVAFLDSDLGRAQECLITLQQQAPRRDCADQVSELEKALNSFDIDAAKVIAQRLRMS